MKKKILLLFTLLLFLVPFADSQCVGEPGNRNPFRLRFESFTQPSVSDGILVIQGQISFADTVVTDSTLPSASLISGEMLDQSFEFHIEGFSSMLESGTIYIPGQEVSFTLEVGFSTVHPPDELQNLEIEACISGNATYLAVGVYVTPWNTAEVWSTDGLEMLMREWSYDRESYISIPVSSADVPVTDLTAEQYADPDFPKSYYSVEGLAYTIPVAAVVDTFDVINPDSAAGKDGCAHANWQRWNGIISGDITSEVRIDNFNADPTRINMTGLRVELWERDNFPNPDDHLGTGFLNDDGHYAIDIDVCQRFQGSPIGALNEGDFMELYLKVVDINNNETVKVIKRIGGVRKANFLQTTPFFWENVDGAESDQPINLDIDWNASGDLRPQHLHWGHQARIFVNGSHAGTGFSLPTSPLSPLVIMIHPLGPSNGGLFLPAGQTTLATAIIAPFLLGIPAIILQTYTSNHDALYIGDDSRRNENLYLHEFGHYTMWHLQNESWANPIEASFAGHSHIQNDDNEKITWTEGWADGFSSIADHALFRFDNESGFYRREWYERRALQINNSPVEFRAHEDRMFTITDGSTVYTDAVLTHGYLSEMNIAAFLNDLADGPTSFGLASNPGIFNDDFGAGPQDDFELTFPEITRPLRENTGFGFLAGDAVITDIVDYVRYLRRFYDCEGRKSIIHLANHNRLNALQPGRNAPFEDVPGISGDVIERSFNGRYLQFDNIGATTADQIGDVFIELITDVSVIDGLGESFNVALPAFGQNWLFDNLTLQNHGILFFNGDRPIGEVAGSNPHPVPGSHLEAFVCSDEIRIGTNGLMILGATNGNTATVHFMAGSTLVMGGYSALVVEDNSRLIIEKGAKLVFEQHAGIILRGPNSVLEIDGNTYIGDNAVFTFTGDGFIRYGNQFTGGYPNIDCGANASIQFSGPNDWEKKLEVKDNAYFYPSNSLVAFSMQNMRVDLGDAAYVNSANSAFTMNQVRVRAINTSRPHNGIVLNGQSAHTLNHLTISGGTYGIRGYQFWNQGARLRVSNSTITDCHDGITVWDKGALLTLVHLDNNNVGYSNYVSTLNSNAQSSTFNNNDVAGLFFQSSGSNLHLNSPDASQNGLAGALFSGPGSLSSVCGSFNGNGYMGVVVGFGGKLVFDDSKNNVGAQNDVHGNPTSIRLNDASELYMANGKNNLASTNVLTGNDVTGSMLKLCPGTGNILIKPIKNHWNNSPVCTGSSPVNGLDYSLTGTGGCAIELADGVPVCPVTACAFGPPGGGGGGTPLAACATCRKVVTTASGKVYLDAAVRAAIQMMDASPANLPGAITTFYEIFTSDFTGITEEEQWLLDLCRTRMAEAFSSACTEGIVSTHKEDHTPNVCPLTAKVITSLRSEQSRCYAKDPAKYWSINVEQALVYNTIGRRDDALYLLESSMPNLTQNGKALVLEYSCMINLIRKAEAGYLTAVEFQALADQCAQSSGGGHGKLPLESLTAQDKFSLQVYPNPTSGLCILSLHIPEDGWVDYAVYDVLGNPVPLAEGNLFLGAGNHERSVDLTSVAAGVYFLRASAGGQMLTQRMVVLH